MRQLNYDLKTMGAVRDWWMQSTNSIEGCTLSKLATADQTSLQSFTSHIAHLREYVSKLPVFTPPEQPRYTDDHSTILDSLVLFKMDQKATDYHLPKFLDRLIMRSIPKHIANNATSLDGYVLHHRLGRVAVIDHAEYLNPIHLNYILAHAEYYQPFEHWLLVIRDEQRWDKLLESTGQSLAAIYKGLNYINILAALAGQPYE